MIVVSDTSPITGLLAVGEIELLSRLFGEVIIPIGVHRELLLTHPSLPSWIKARSVSNVTRALEFREIVDPGEAEAIELAKELNADRLLIDDFLGRQLAERQGLKIIGLLGVVLLAKSQGLIPSARHLLARLKTEAHSYLSEDIVERALASIGE
jgi:predicted nucleic acid-binding protein